MSNPVSKSDIPSVEELRSPFLLALKSGKQKSIASVEREVASILGLSAAQRNYKIKGSKTALFSNRLADVRSSLRSEGLIDLPKQGKVQLTEPGKQAVEQLLPGNEKAESTAVSKQSGDNKVVGSKKEPAAVPSSSKPAMAITPAPTIEETKPFKQDSSEIETPINQTPAKKGPSSQANTQSFGNPASPSTNPLSQIATRVSTLGGNIKTIVAVLCVILAFAAGSCTGNSIAQSQANENMTQIAKQWQQEVEAKAVARSEASELSFIVTSKDSSDKNTTAVIHVTGKSDDSKTVDDYYQATPNTPYALDYGAGIYLIELVENDTKYGNKVYKHDAMKVAYSDEQSLQVELNLELDEDLTKAKEEEAQKKAEEEARAKAEAEERAKKEAEEKARAEQEKKEAEAAAAAAAAASASEKTEVTVYITETGKKYHSPGCRYLKDSCIPISLSDAKARGYTACKVCGG